MAVELLQTSAEARRRAWLRTAYALGAHRDDCFACTLEWATDCDEGQRLRAESDAAWDAYDGVGQR